jgi:nitrite reductase (NADH) large subunit
VAGRIFGLVAPGYQMAEVAARHIAGEERAVPRRRHEHQAQADGRRRRLDRRRARARAGALNYVFTDEARVYKKLVVRRTASSCSARSWSATLRLRPLLQLALNAMPLPEHPEDLILPRARRREGLGVDCCRRGADLLVQQRVEGQICAREGGCTRSAR